MHFKQIEITGFKSFADPTTIELDSGITSVVGPNGCGKSNILDAMRWALGEQKAKALRGAHMQDVIFNGSEERAPMSMAEVTLTFDNADGTLPIDFTEVQITRRIYRSGESEYLINKAQCRMRDIQELFMDTGIGTNAYSMIGQGKIGMVLSSKPEDRRYLFEEAAGIIKYKARKRVALRKLDQAEQNLLRLGDIIHELERQMKSLKRQVNAAIRHRELTDELKEFEIRASWLKQSYLMEQITELRTKFDEAQKKFDVGSTEMSTLEAKHEEVSLGKLEIDRVLHARREGVHEIDVEMEKLERQIALIKQQIEFSIEQHEKALADKESFATQAQSLLTEFTETSEKTGSLKEEHQKFSLSLESKQDEQAAAIEEVTQADTQLEAVRARSVESMGKRAENQTAIETLSVNISNIEEQLQALYTRQEADNQRNEELVQDIESKEHSETEQKAALGNLEDENRTAKQIQADLTQQIATVNTEWQALRETKSSSEARLKSFRELRDSYEGFAQGVKAIMKAKNHANPQVQGVLGPIGDLISTSADYERAVEAVLGGNINNIAIDQAEQAKGAINYLKETKAGRVTFLPLDTIRPGSRDNIGYVTGKPGVVGPALEVVEFEERLRPIMEYIFHNTVIVETIDVAIHLSRGSEPIPRMVTKDGEVVSASGAVTGGRTKHDSRGLIGRSAEIEELEAQVLKLDEQIRSVTQKGAALGESLETVNTRVTTLSEQEEQQRHALSNIAMEITQASTEIENLTEALKTITVERDELYARRDAFEEQRRANQDAATSMETEDEALQREIADAQENASKIRQAQSELSAELSDLRVVMANITKSIEENERETQRLEREREQALSALQDREVAIKQFKENQVTLENDIKDNVEHVKAMTESKEEARKKVNEAENQRQALLDESDELEKKLKVIRDLVRETQGAVHKFEIDLRHDEDQLIFFQERILEEYHIALGSLTAEEVGTDELSEEERDALVQDTRTKLERLGNVNLMAIEEYDALTERFEFLVSQDQDLTKAKDALLHVVARIDETIKDMFLVTFNAVAENFRSYFRRLFNGGQARIYLVDEEDPLECGIEIEAKPPGKKPQSIALLSGGEQAMTAIALLFSIFKAKPSPFCVLDEVDAPLDDANIGRFIEMVEEFSVETQFVVITHNKQTMAKASALYGVTQLERGVSQIVSVKFEGHDTKNKSKTSAA
ncbi:MAG: chromosome segregation protein SMC [Candidatus Hydrogenedentota bacterium]